RTCSRSCYSRAPTLVVGATSDEPVGFGDVLRRYRVAAGLTQEALADRAALSPRGISDLERSARTHPYPSTVHRLAEALGPSEADRDALEAAATRSPRDAPETRGSASGSHGLLPAPPSSFVGREHDVA